MPDTRFSADPALSRTHARRNHSDIETILLDMGGSVAGSNTTVSGALHVLGDVFTGRRSVSGGAGGFAGVPTRNLADDGLDVTLNDGTRITIIAHGGTTEITFSSRAAILV